MKVIPLHCVVIVLGPSSIGRQKSTMRFADHEVLTTISVRRDLVGARELDQAVILQEIVRRVQLKLRLGERVVIDVGNIRKEDRLTLANSARVVGAPCFYALPSKTDPSTGADEAESYRQIEREVSMGDGVAEVVVLDGGVYPSQIVQPKQPDSVAGNWQGMTVIGDVHGMHQAFLSALSWARSRGHYVILLGDIIDYGPGSLEVSDDVYKMVMRGEGELILGNHERKIMRWIDGRRVRLSEGNKVTTAALGAVGETSRARWVGRFRALYQQASMVRQIGNLAFAHGAYHPALWSDTSEPREVENFAFFGEVDHDASAPERPTRTYRWVDSIPADRTVVVGHDIRSHARPVVQTNSGGGSAIFLDTGCGKGGHLSTADFRGDSGQFKLVNFNMF